MELQKVVGALEAEGIALYAISYDPPEALGEFAARHGITFPLLSDADSAFIKELGVLNAEAPAQVAGIPHPGVFVLAPDGTVREKHFYDSYRERDTGTGLLEQVLGIAAPTHGPEVEATADVVRVRAWLDAPRYVWGQRLWLSVELTIADGYHVYGRPIPAGYQPLEIVLDPLERVTVGEPRLPDPAPFRVQGLDEQFQVYHGTVRVTVPITFMVVDAGDQHLRGEVRLQACTSIDCAPPHVIPFALTLPEAPLVERPQR